MVQLNKTRPREGRIQSSVCLVMTPLQSHIRQGKVAPAHSEVHVESISVLIIDFGF